MSIVLNEIEYAKKILNDREIGQRPIESLLRIAKYYLSAGYNKRDIRSMLENFMVECDPSTVLSRWSETLDRVVKSASKYPPIEIDSIEITSSEIERINSLNGRQVRRLAFTLLCMAKYYYKVSEKNDHWVNTPDNEIMRMANINTSIKRQSVMFSQLRDAGMIRFSSRIDNTNVQVLFADDGEVAMRIIDLRNLGYQYSKFCGEYYLVCEHCGITYKGNENTKKPSKYCPECAVKIKTKQSVDSVMRRRKILK